MEMMGATGWWVAAGLAVVAELATGTFYLLMIGLGLAAGAIAAHLGATMPWQILVAAVVGGGASLGWNWWRRAHGPAHRSASENRDVNLDIGEHVHVAAWHADGTARVQHRGSSWGARLAPGAAAHPGEYTVTAVEGNWLVLSPRAPR